MQTYSEAAEAPKGGGKTHIESVQWGVWAILFGCVRSVSGPAAAYHFIYVYTYIYTYMLGYLCEWYGSGHCQS